MPLSALLEGEFFNYYIKIGRPSFRITFPICCSLCLSIPRQGRLKCRSHFEPPRPFLNSISHRQHSHALGRPPRHRRHILPQRRYVTLLQPFRLLSSPLLTLSSPDLCFPKARSASSSQKKSTNEPVFLENPSATPAASISRPATVTTPPPSSPFPFRLPPSPHSPLLFPQYLS